MRVEVLEAPMLARATKYRKAPSPMLNSPVPAISKSEDMLIFVGFFPLKVHAAKRIIVTNGMRTLLS